MYPASTFDTPTHCSQKVMLETRTVLDCFKMGQMAVKGPNGFIQLRFPSRPDGKSNGFQADWYGKLLPFVRNGLTVAPRS